ncbi:unnamed protein product [Eruca vesicaria subsp. sativa]|uniref:Uncharacterized protein n=1 Tax=Eruca vesicaria subsp. sativa TaxID=29727 RepID=A0ABC8JLB9_ERUVS|nr:unnamed protein product [Eruca vesicaria subsp. sativa]
MGLKDVVELLLDREAEVDPKDRWGSTNVDVIKILEMHGAKHPMAPTMCSVRFTEPYCIQGTYCMAMWRGIQLAVKKLEDKVLSDDDQVRKFHDELALLQRLRHPNIVQFLGAVTQSNPMMIVTEYLARGDLREFLKRKGQLKPATAVRYALDIARGMSYLHEIKGDPIIHRWSFGQGKIRMNKRTSLAQKEDVIRRTVYVSEIDQQVSFRYHLSPKTASLNLSPLQVTEENLAGVFANCGQVVDCRVCGDPNSLLCFAFVEFTSEEGARAALSMSGTVLGFYPLKSEIEREMCMRTVCCTNIDKRISQTDLKGFFEMFCGELLVKILLFALHLTSILSLSFFEPQKNWMHNVEYEVPYKGKSIKDTSKASLSPR